MRTWIVGAITLAASGALALGAHAQDQGVELAFMRGLTTKTVTLLNDGGQVRRHRPEGFPQGGTCRMDKDATPFQVGPAALPATCGFATRRHELRRASLFLTVFDLPDAEYAIGRAAFAEKEDQAKKNVEEIEKDLGEKWDEVTGKKPSSSR